MKTLCIIIFGLACVLPAQARSYQAIINDLRVEVKKGDAKVVALDEKIGHLDTWAKDRWEKEQAALKQVEKLKALNKRVFLMGVGSTLLVGVIAIALVGRRKSPGITVVEEASPPKARPKKVASKRKVTR